MKMVQFVLALVIGLFLAFAECHPSKVDSEFESAREIESKDKKQKWGYVDVRSDAHIFYWLYYTSHPDGHEKRPWIIWLQGGPGASSCGFGNFQIIGPLKPDLSPRNATWVKQASVLFIDSPVGAGFSYVDNSTAKNTEVSHIIDDLMKLLRVFLKRTPIFQTRPLYIFGESYGGKVAAYLSQRLCEEIKGKSIEVQLVGVAMGGAWISPPDLILNHANFAFWMSLIDAKTRDICREKAHDVKVAIDAGEWTKATDINWASQSCVIENANSVNIYDASKFETTATENAKIVLVQTMEKLKETLRIIPANITWTDVSWDTFSKLREHYMKSSISVVDELLDSTDLQVIIYQGQMDMISHTKGANAWVQKLNWSSLTSYTEAERKAVRNPADNQTEFYVKAFGKFKFYTILRAGHMVPHDQPDAAFRMLDRILNNLDQ